MTLKITGHARREAFADRISVADIKEVLRIGEIVRLYAEDRPYPSRLVLGFVDGNPIHVVAAQVPGTDQTVVITTYRPDPDIWEGDYKKRKS
jgi:hypothetical protein